MKDSKKRLDSFFAASKQYLDFNSGKDKENKLLYALRKMRKRLNNDYETYLDDIQEIRINLASVNDKGDIIIHNNQYDFKPEKLKEFNKKVKEKGAEEIEFEPYFATEIPADLPYSYKEAFINFVIEETEII